MDGILFAGDLAKGLFRAVEQSALTHVGRTLHRIHKICHLFGNPWWTREAESVTHPVPIEIFLNGASLGALFFSLQAAHICPHPKINKVFQNTL
jgi:hypothetical protein